MYLLLQPILEHPNEYRFKYLLLYLSDAPEGWCCSLYITVDGKQEGWSVKERKIGGWRSESWLASSDSSVDFRVAQLCPVLVG